MCGWIGARSQPQRIGGVRIGASYARMRVRVFQCALAGVPHQMQAAVCFSDHGAGGARRATALRCPCHMRGEPPAWHALLERTS